MAARLVLAVALSPLVLAFSHTIPVISWSSSSSIALDSLPSTLSNTIHSASLLESILSEEDVCNHDAIVLVQQPGLHASDLRTLSPNTHIARSLYSSPSARQFPYVPHGQWDISSLAEDVSSRCKSRMLKYAPGEGGITLEHGTKHVVCLDMPAIGHAGKNRKVAMKEHASVLGEELLALASVFPDHLIIIAGSSFPAHEKRQSPDADLPSRPVLDLSPSSPSSFGKTVYINANTTLPEGGILKRYQLLTPGLITVLLISFFVLVPVVMLGVSALASIQNPLRTDIPKGFSAQDKKNQ
ncbi:BIG/ATPase V1 complex, subunit S1 [Crucibulum laeve]|uniref:Protein BIG1 n=1 Tax=Crucibulum laeve TaxID=68775 RepID=A0A5C3MDY1_9AGAR|nr:BIG/ATPase V1 complex, subunit S1 [Crucibulum laeve]